METTSSAIKRTPKSVGTGSIQSQKLQDKQINYLNEDNNINIYYQIPFSNNQQKLVNCLFSNEDKKLWLSPTQYKKPLSNIKSQTQTNFTNAFPHVFIVDFTKANLKPKYYRYLSIRCWHAYSSNPSQIKIYFSLDGKTYVQWGAQTFNLELMAGTQVFRLKEKIDANQVKFMKIEIVKTFSTQPNDSKCYMNQIMLFENYNNVGVGQCVNSSNPIAIVNSSSSNNTSKSSNSTSQTSIQDQKQQQQYQQQQQQFFSYTQFNNNSRIDNQQPFQLYDPTSQIRTLETQYDIDCGQPLSYQNSIDTTYVAFQNNDYNHNNNNNYNNKQPLQSKLSNLSNELENLQQQSFEQFKIIQRLRQNLEGQPCNENTTNIFKFFNGLQNGYQSIQTQMVNLSDKVDILSQSMVYAKSTMHNQVSSYSQDNENNTHHHQSPQQNNSQNQHLNGTSTFRNNNKENAGNNIDKSDLVSQCMEFCKNYIHQEFSRFFQIQQQQQHIQQNQKSQRKENLQQSQQNQRFEKSLERRIEKFIASQQKQNKNLSENENQENIDHNQINNSRGFQEKINNSLLGNDVQKIAQELQLKLAIKAKKLQELQEREESKMTMTSQSCSSDNSSVISNCSSLLKMKNHQQDHIYQNLKIPNTIQNLSKVFQYDVEEGNNGVNFTNDQNITDQDDDVESQIEKYFISSHREDTEQEA